MYMTVVCENKRTISVPDETDFSPQTFKSLFAAAFYFTLNASVSLACYMIYLSLQVSKK